MVGVAAEKAVVGIFVTRRVLEISRLLSRAVIVKRLPSLAEKITEACTTPYVAVRKHVPDQKSTQYHNGTYRQSLAFENSNAFSMSFQRRRRFFQKLGAPSLSPVVEAAGKTTKRRLGL